MKPYKKILAAIWMTKHCEKTIDFAVDLAASYGAELVVMHVVDTFWLQNWNLPMMSIEEEHKRDVVKIKSTLDGIVAGYQDRGVKITTVVREGDPSDEMLKFIGEEKIDFIVLRAQQEGRIEHFMIGGSNDRIIHKAPCSVMLLKS